MSWEKKKRIRFNGRTVMNHLNRMSNNTNTSLVLVPNFLSLGTFLL